MGRYDDIIGLPHHVSKTRPRMSMIDRGAQFSPFAALTGYEAVLAESTRQTQNCVDLDPGEIEKLDEAIRELMDRIRERPEAVFTCFQPDEWKEGGAYVEISGRLKHFDPVENCLILTDGTRIEIESITAVRTG